MMDEYELENQGIDDIFAGNESYAERYMRGVLFSNDIVSLKDVNGSEGLLADVGSKIKQFINWLWNKMKAAWKFVFDKQAETLTIRIKPIVANKNNTHEVKDGVAAKLASDIERGIENVTRAHETFIKNLVSLNNEAKKFDELAFLTLGIMSVEAYENRLAKFKELVGGHADKLKNANTPNSLLAGLNGALLDVEVYSAWLASFLPGIKMTKGYNEETKNKFNDALTSSLSKSKEQQNEAALTIKYCKVGDNLVSNMGNLFKEIYGMVNKAGGDNYFQPKK